MCGIFAALFYAYTYSVCVIFVHNMSQVTRSVDGTMTSSTAAGIDVNKSKREQVIDEVIATETAYTSKASLTSLI